MNNMKTNIKKIFMGGLAVITLTLILANTSFAAGPSAPIVSGPLSVTIGEVASRYGVASTITTGKITYKVYIDTTTKPTIPKYISGPLDSGSAFAFNHTFTVADTYYMKVVATDGTKSATTSKTITASIVKPTTPVITGPPTVAVGTASSQFSVVSSAKSTNKITYKVYIDTTTTPTTPKYTSSPFDSDDAYTFNHTFTVADTYYMKIVAYDGISNSATTSKTITANIVKPTTPIFTGANQIKLGETNSVFSFLSSTANGRQVTYKVYLDTITPPKKLETTSVPYNSGATYNFIHTFPAVDNYYLYVVAYDGVSYSATSTNVIYVVNDKLTTPIVIGPTSVILGDTNNSFGVVATSGINNNINYKVYVGTVNPPPTLDSTSGYISSTQVYPFTKTFDSADTYYIRVVADDGFDFATSAVKTVTVKKSAVPVITGPDTVALGEQNTEFSTIFSTTSTRTINYSLYIGTTSPNAKSIFVNYTGPMRSPQAFSFTHTFDKADTYYIKVNASDGLHTYSSAVKSVIVKIQKPLAPVIVGPTSVTITNPQGDFSAFSTTQSTNPITYKVYMGAGTKLGTLQSTSPAITSGGLYVFNQAFPATIGSYLLTVVANDGYSIATSTEKITVVAVTDINDVYGQVNPYVGDDSERLGGSATINRRRAFIKPDGWASYPIVFMTVKYFAQVLNASTGRPYSPSGENISTSDTLRLHFVPQKAEHVFWFISGASTDSPYGSWAQTDGAVPPLSARVPYKAPDSINGTLAFSVTTPNRTWEIPSQLNCGSPISNADGSKDMLCQLKPNTALGTKLTTNFVFAPTKGYIFWNEAIGRFIYGGTQALALNYIDISAGTGDYLVTGLPTKIPFTFTVGTSTPNSLFALNLTGDTTGSITETLNYQAQATNLNGTDISYYINVSDLTENRTISSNTTVTGYMATTTYNFTESWSTSGIKHVCAIARDHIGVGNYTNWSCLTVNIANSCTINCGGGSGMTLNNNCTSKTSSTITWPIITGASYYNLYYSNAQFISSTTNTSLTVNSPGTYYVGVVDSGGVESYSSPITIDCAGYGDNICSNNAINYPTCNICNTSAGATYPIWNGTYCTACTSGTWDGTKCKTGPTDSIACRGAAPFGFIVKSSKATSGGTGTDPLWHYVPKIEGVDQNGSTCDWTCQEDDENYTYSKVGNSCVQSAITEN
ncbi:MAG: hypothetical protein WAV11_00590 [Minisyncoccia bacterium]